MVGRALAALVAALIGVGAVAGGSAGATADECGVERVRTAQGTWSLVPLPTIQHSPVRDALYAPSKPSWRPHDYAIGAHHTYIADMWSIYESVDGGCSWRRSFDVARDVVPTDGELGTVKIAALASRGSRRAETAFAIVDDSGTPVLATKRVGDDEWTLSAVTSGSPAAPVVGHPKRMWLSATGRTIYLLVDPVQDLTPGSALELYGSDDGGESWSLRHVYAFTAGVHQPPAAGDMSCALGSAHCLLAPPLVMAVDPVDPKLLWTSNDMGVFRSADGGLTWSNVYPAGSNVLGEVGAIVVDHRRSERVVAFATAKLAWSDDGGETWRLVDAPRGVDAGGRRNSSASLDSAAVDSAGDILVAHVPSESFAGTNMQLRLPGGEWTDVAAPMLRCPQPASAGEPPDCVTRLSHAGRSFYGITVGGTALVSFRVGR